jgi:NTP pyrophosphatase (non-canonical NTP hydrolase)
MNQKQVEVINEVALEMFQNAVNKGFHDKDDAKPLLDNYGAWCNNLHDEVSELWTAVRKGKLELPCDKAGCDLTNEEEELADIVIRAMDTASKRGINLGEAICKKYEYNTTRPRMHGNCLC